MRKSKARRKRKAQFGPTYKWQVDNYANTLDVKLSVPQNVLLICKLAGVTPIQVVKDFLANLAFDSTDTSDLDKARHLLVDYFIEMGYGKPFYSESDFRQILTELQFMTSLFPVDAKMPLIELHARWREKYEKYWFKKWYYKTRRK